MKASAVLLTLGFLIASATPLSAKKPKEEWVPAKEYDPKGGPEERQEFNRLGQMLSKTKDPARREELLLQFRRYIEADPLNISPEFSLPIQVLTDGSSRAVSILELVETAQSSENMDVSGIVAATKKESPREFFWRKVQETKERRAREQEMAQTPPMAVPEAVVPLSVKPQEMEALASIVAPEPKQADFNPLTNNPNLDRPDARRQLADLRTRYPDDPAISALAGAAAFKAGDFREAAEMLDGPVAANPGNADLRYLRGATRLNLGNNDAAADDLEAALRLDPKLTQADDLLHLLRRKVDARGADPSKMAAGRPDGGPDEGDDLPAPGFSAAVQAALRDRLPSPVAAALIKDARSKARVRDVPGEIAALNAAVAADPGHPGARLMLGEALLKAGRPDEAAKEADALLKLVPGHAGALNIRATARNRRGDHAGALADADAALAQVPNSPLGHWARAYALAGLGRRRESLEALRRAAEIDARFKAAAERLALLPPDADPLVAFGGAATGAVPAEATPRPSLRRRLSLGFGGLGAALFGVGLVVLYRRRERLGVESVPRWDGVPARAPAGAPPDQPAAAPAPSTFGPGSLLCGVYRVERELGRGSMGVVLKALDQTLKRPVAIKMLQGYARGRPEATARLLREAQLVAALKHPNVVQVLTASAHGEDVLLVFEYAEARALSEVLADFDRLPLADAVRIVGQVASALDHAHGRRVIHRDLKPANILVKADGTALVTDFGLAHEASSSAWRETSAPGWGSPAYMAPEQEDGKVSAASDVYSLGACFYEMVTGAPPFLEPAGREAKRRMEFQPPSRRLSGLPPAVDEAVRRALDARPDARFRTAGEFAKALSSSGGA